MMMIDHKCDLVLIILNKFPILGIVKLEKLLWILQERTSLGNVLEPRFKFSDGTLGPFSYEVYDVIQLLKSWDLIKTTETTFRSAEDREYFRMLDDEMMCAKRAIDEPTHIYCLTQKGKKISDKLKKSLSWKEKRILNKFDKKWVTTPLIPILCYVYDECKKVKQ